MRSLGSVLAGVAAAAVAAVGGTAWAWPATAYTSDELPGDRAQCMARAQRALTAEGWYDLRVSAGGVGVHGHKQPSSGYILCLDAPKGSVPRERQLTGAILAIVFVASDGSATVASDEAARLQQRMIQP